MSQALMQLFSWKDANRQQLQQEQRATKGAVGRHYEEEIQQAEDTKSRLQQELDEEKTKLQQAQQKTKMVLKANPWQETQTQIDQINSELRSIEDGMLAKKIAQNIRDQTGQVRD